MSDAAPSGRHGRRARQLLQRYLVAFGPLHGIARSAVALDQLTSAAADTIAALRAELARRAEPAVVFVEAGTQPVAPIAALIARELGLRLYEVTAERALAQPEPLARWLARVLAAAAATPAALVLPDLSTLVASDGGELLLPLLRAHRGIAFAHARERALFSGAP
jgi:hypothetical protein